MIERRPSCRERRESTKFPERQDFQERRFFDPPHLISRRGVAAEQSEKATATATGRGLRLWLWCDSASIGERCFHGSIGRIITASVQDAGEEASTCGL